MEKRVPWLLPCSDDFQVLQLVHLPRCYGRQVLIGLVHWRLWALPAWLSLCVPRHFLGLHIRHGVLDLCVPCCLVALPVWCLPVPSDISLSLCVFLSGQGGTFLFSDTTKVTRLILYIHCFSLWIGHFSKQHWFLIVENVNAFHKICRKGMTNNIFCLGLQVGRLPLKISVECCCSSTFVQDGDWRWETV